MTNKTTPIYVIAETLDGGISCFDIIREDGLTKEEAVARSYTEYEKFWGVPLKGKFITMSEDDYVNKRRQQALAVRQLKEVTRDDWDNYLGVLPPVNWHTDSEGVNKFLMSEYYDHSVTLQCAEYLGKYYCAHVDVNDKSTWIAKSKIESL